MGALLTAPPSTHGSPSTIVGENKPGNDADADAHVATSDHLALSRKSLVSKSLLSS
jgi:hypothetical protein